MTVFGVLCLVCLGVTFSAVTAGVIPVGDLPSRHVQLQAHRGGLGLRPESTLWAFAYAMEVGVDVLEMDMVFTKDEIPVIWHDHWIYPQKCNDTTGDFVGKFIANLTLSELKTLDCGSQQIAGHPQAELHPNSSIATLEEVLNLVDCYGDKDIQLNIETKLDPLRPNETLPLETYISSPRFIPLLKSRGFLRRSTIQSFDWRTLIGLKKIWKAEVTTVALVDHNTIAADDGRGEGHYPWLGGVDLSKQYSGSYLEAAKAIGASVISPIFGRPGTVNTPGHTRFVNKAMVSASHKLGLKVVPWTVDDESSISYLLQTGVDGIISNYPERVGWVARQRGLRTGKSRRPTRAYCLTRALISP